MATNPNSVQSLDGVQREWLDLAGLRKYAAVSDRTLRGWMHRAVNPLPASRVGKKILIKRTIFDRWIESHAVTPADSVDVGELANAILADLRVKN